MHMYALEDEESVSDWVVVAKPASIEQPKAAVSCSHDLIHSHDLFCTAKQFAPALPSSRRENRWQSIVPLRSVERSDAFALACLEAAGHKLRAALQPIRERILEDRLRLLNMEWDEELGAQPARVTIETASGLLLLIAKQAFARGHVVALPRITFGPDAGIDICWNEKHFEGLIHVPEVSALISYFFFDRGALSIKGTFDLAVPKLEGLIEWVTQ